MTLKDSRPLRPLAYVSLIYGGFLVITYLAFVYFAVWRHEFLPIFPENPRFASQLDNATGAFPPRRELEAHADPLASAFSPQALGVLFTGLLFLANGYFLLAHLREKEHKETKDFVISSLLTEEEKAVYDALAKAGGQATQKQLSLSTGFSPVKAYRVIKRLEGKKIVQSFPFGMTKKIVLNEA